MERPIFKPVGTPVEELDTPVLVVDLDMLDKNIQAMESFFRKREAKLRPHMEAHRCPAIAHKQMKAEGTVGGICVGTVGQAEVFAQSGFDDIFVANEVVTDQKIERLCALAHASRIMTAVDSGDMVQRFSQAAVAHGVSLDLVVDINTRLNRCGVEPGRPAVDLATEVNKAPGLRFAGLMTYEGPMFIDDAEELLAESCKWIQMVLDTRELAEKAGLEVGVVSVGGTYNYHVAGALDGVTEVPAGSYVLSDGRYKDAHPEFRPAARVMATVTSTPEPGTIITDMGQKAIGPYPVDPTFDGGSGLSLKGLSAEHGNITIEEGAGSQPDLGDKVWMTPSEIGTCANLYDYIHAVRNGRLEAVWEVAARGQYR
jgi:D-serine deaminase-like pyridoxal phosphate-dependent protein